MKKRGKKKRGRQNQKGAGMMGIIFVACLLLVGMIVNGYGLQKKVEANAARQEELQRLIEEENARTEEITAMRDYMQSDEYIEKTAREKLGMVKDNEILFKESD